MTNRKVVMKTIRFIFIVLLSLLAGFIICISLLLLIYGDGGNPHASGVSENVEKSKEIGVFIQEYKIDNIQVIDSNYTFPIESVWMEMAWYEDLTKPVKDRIPEIDSLESHIVFKLKKTSKKDFFNVNNYFDLWVINDVGMLLNDKVIMRNIVDKQDTIPLVINKLQKPFDTENTTPLFTFDLLRIVDEN